MKVRASIIHGFVQPIPEIIDEDRLDFGGKDIDNLIRDEFIKRWKTVSKKSINIETILNNPRINWILTKKAKEVKEKLSKN